MLIVDHIGETLKEYRLLCGRYFPEARPTCGSNRLRVHDHYMHNAGDEEPVPIYRYRCNRRGCRQIFTVLPDLFEPGQSIPTATQEKAVFQYAATVSTCSQAAETAGVSASTVWRWVDRAAGMAAQWVAYMQTWLHSLHPGSHVAVAVNETLRPRWLGRRLRLVDKVTRLLLLERLPGLVTECRREAKVIMQRLPGTAVLAELPSTCLGCCWRVLPRLIGSGGT